MMDSMGYARHRAMHYDDRHARSLVMNLLAVRGRTETGMTTREVAEAMHSTSNTARRRLQRLEFVEGKVERVRHGRLDLWYLRPTLETQKE